MNNFSKLYLLSPESYNKIIFDKMTHQGIDREMYNILNMKKIADSKKWYMYRDELVKFANKARNNKILDGEHTNVKSLKYSVQAQTNIGRRPRIDQNIQAEKKRESGVQTDHIIDADYYDGNTDATLNNEQDLSENRSWSYAEALPEFTSFNASNSKSPPVDASTPATSKNVAKQVLNKAKRPTLRKAYSTDIGGKPDAQRLINFQILKSPRKTRANVKAAASVVQTGNNRFKWTCMK